LAEHRRHTEGVDRAHREYLDAISVAADPDPISTFWTEISG
jgi:hypothetical protein